MAGFRPRKTASKKKIVEIGHPHAGKGMGREELKSDLQRILREGLQGHAAVDLEQRFTDTLEEFDGVVEERIVLGGADIVIVWGGDGTLKQLLARLLKFLTKYLLTRPKPPDILFTGMGTQNIILKNFGLMGDDPRKSMAKFVRRVQLGIEPDRLNRMVMQVNGDPGFTYGAGIPARFLEKYYEKKPGGPRRAFKVMLWTLWNEFARHLPPWRRRSMFERFGAEVTLTSGGVERRLEMDRFSGILAGTVQEVGMNCRALPRADDDPGGFQIRLVDFGFKSLLPNIWPIFTGGQLIGPVADEVVSKAVIRLERPMKHMIDGEMVEPESFGETVTIEPGPYLKFIRC